jgi:hypothetical protein
VLTVLHRKGGEPGKVAELMGGAEPVDGWTACGRPMLASESWTAIDFRTGDTVCVECLGESPAVLAETETTLW